MIDVDNDDNDDKNADNFCGDSNNDNDPENSSVSVSSSD